MSNALVIISGFGFCVNRDTTTVIIIENTMHITPIIGDDATPCLIMFPKLKSFPAKTKPNNTINITVNTIPLMTDVIAAVLVSFLLYNPKTKGPKKQPDKVPQLSAIK